MSSRISLLLRGSAFRVLQTVVSIIIGFLMMPFLIGTLGRDLYGLWVVVTSVVGTYYLLDMGFSQAITRFVAKYIHQRRFEDANRVINTALLLYCLLGLLVLAASVLFAKFGAAQLLENADQVTLVQTLLLITGLQLAIEFPSKAFPGIMSAYMRFDWIAKIRTLKVIIDALLIFLLIRNGYGLVSMALVGFSTGIISTIAYVALANRVFSDIKYSMTLVDLPTFRSVYNFSKWVFILDLTNTLRDKMDIWFIAYFLGNSTLTIYYVSIRLVDYAVRFLTQATSMTGPVFTELYAREQWGLLRTYLVRFLKLDLAFGAIVIAGFALVGQLFISLWMGSDFPVSDTWHCLIVLTLGRLSVYITSPLQSILLTFKEHHRAAKISIVETVAICGLCLYLVPRAGIVGAAYAVAVPAVVGRLILLPLVTQGVFNFLSTELIVRLSAFVGFVTYAILAALNVRIAAGKGIVELLANSLVISIVILILSIGLLNAGDRKFIVTKFSRAFDRSE